MPNIYDKKTMYRNTSHGAIFSISYNTLVECIYWRLAQKKKRLSLFLLTLSFPVTICFFLLFCTHEYLAWRIKASRHCWNHCWNQKQLEKFTTTTNQRDIESWCECTNHCRDQRCWWDFTRCENRKPFCQSIVVVRSRSYDGGSKGGWWQRWEG